MGELAHRLRVSGRREQPGLLQASCAEMAGGIVQDQQALKTDSGGQSCQRNLSQTSSLLVRKKMHAFEIMCGPNKLNLQQAKVLIHFQCWITGILRREV